MLFDLDEAALERTIGDMRRYRPSTSEDLVRQRVLELIGWANSAGTADIPVQAETSQDIWLLYRRYAGI